MQDVKHPQMSFAWACCFVSCVVLYSFVQFVILRGSVQFCAICDFAWLYLFCHNNFFIKKVSCMFFFPKPISNPPPQKRKGLLPLAYFQAQSRIKAMFYLTQNQANVIQTFDRTMGLYVVCHTMVQTMFIGGVLWCVAHVIETQAKAMCLSVNKYFYLSHNDVCTKYDDSR